MSANLHTNLQRLRVELGLSLSTCGRRRVGEGATKLEIERARAKWHSWETGRVRIPAEELPHVARVFELGTHELLDRLLGGSTADNSAPGCAA